MSAESYKSKKNKVYLLVYCELINAARYRGTTTYQAIAQIMGLPLKGGHMAGEVGKILYEIVKDELDNKRPMLSAVAVGVNGLPGPGFFVLARDLGKLQDVSEDEQRQFWEKEKEAVYAAWKREFKA